MEANETPLQTQPVMEANETPLQTQPVMETTEIQFIKTTEIPSQSQPVIINRGDYEEIVVPLCFFLFLITCVIISAWKRKKLETLRHETARLLIEKNPTADYDTFKLLFNPPAPAPKPGIAYRIMKIVGTIIMATGLGLLLMSICIAITEGNYTALNVIGPATMVATIGAAVFFAARFMPRPSSKDLDAGTASEPPVNRQEF